MDTFRHALFLVGVIAAAGSLVCLVFVGLCLALDRWIGIYEVHRDHDDDDWAAVQEHNSP